MSTLTGLIPTIYEAVDVVSRELIGFASAVTRNTSAERAAVNQIIMVPITTAQPLQDTVPGVTAPNTGAQVVTNVSMTISKSKHVPIQYTGEEQKGLLNAGTYNGILKNQFVQAFRSLSNQMEIDLFTTAMQGACRAYGTPGTAPLGTAGDLSDIAQVRKILDDNGAPQTDLQLVLGSSAVANMRGKQSLLLKINESGSNALLRRGSISDLPVEGFNLFNSNAIRAVAKGTGAGYTTNTAGYAVGATDITMITGTGTVLAGDTISFAGDANKYGVVVGIAAPGVVSIAAPGLQQAIPAAATAVTVGATATSNVAFSQSAIHLITRAPASPIGPDGRSMDLAEDTILVTDPVSGITFEVAMYRQFMQVVYHVRLAWGYANVKPAHCAILLG